MQALFTDQPLALLPGVDMPLRGPALRTTLEAHIPALGSLRLAVMDFDARARPRYLLGRYHMQVSGGGRTGTFIMVTADQARAAEFAR